MAKKFLILVLLLSISFSGITAVKADGVDTGRPWKNHQKPYDFLFYNLIDNHQQMKLRKDGTLHGFIYIQFTGNYVDGVPEAVRADCTNPSLDCRVGWEVIGIPVSGAKLIQRGPRLWELDQAYLSLDPEFVHFHWTAINGSPNPKKPCGLKTIQENENISYNGYLFKRTAVTTFYWLGGNPEKGKGRLVTPCVDLHSNIYGIWSGGDGGAEEDHEEGDCAGHEPGGEEDGNHDSGGGH